MNCMIICGNGGRKHRALSLQFFLWHTGTMRMATVAGQGALSAGFFGALLRGQEQATLADPAREAAVMQSGIPCSIVGVGAVESAPGQLSSLDFRQVGQDVLAKLMPASPSC